jgi:hypothetical protein
MTQARMMKLTIVELDDRLHCAYLGDFRIAGDKPWGGGKTVRVWTVRESDILDALEWARADL